MKPITRKQYEREVRNARYAADHANNAAEYDKALARLRRANARLAATEAAS
jgi:hypothetical protein